MAPTTLAPVGDRKPKLNAGKVAGYVCLVLFVFFTPPLNLFALVYGFSWLKRNGMGIGSPEMIEAMLGALGVDLPVNWDLVTTNLGPALRLQAMLPLGKSTVPGTRIESTLSLVAGGEPVVELRRVLRAPPAVGPGRTRVPLRFLVLLSPLDLGAAEAGSCLEGTLRVSLEGSDIPLPFRLSVPAAALARPPSNPAGPRLGDASAAPGEDRGPCLVCGEDLAEAAAACQGCQSWVHVECADVLGVCPAKGCGL